jgi:nicotinamidase-related amidase
VIAPLSRARAALLVVDIQERLAPAMPEAVLAQVVRNTKILIEAARRLGLPIVASQQYPKGLGPTIAPIEESLSGAQRFDKVDFSAARWEGLPKRDQWIVCGMEAHVCVFQTARDLVAKGYAVHVPADAICSRTKENWKIARKLLDRAGAIVTSTEVVVFDLLERAGSDDFKALSRAIK